ncbi:hypothetical protein [Pedobacter faecalis]|uniref:hypothetical protein n=1 Tax=Pedobacter faecalis TaxID=3041495 RepID=UPI00254E9C98|nr:hypothetical protein [Pedobacter sp. ELA7]
MNTENTTQGITVITPAEIQSASQILAKTKGWVAGYSKKRDELLILANAEGVKLTAETDQKINDFLAGIKKAAAAAEDARKPFTQRIQEIVKLYTAEESKLKNDLATELQAKRNASVAAYAKEEAEKRAAEQLLLDKEKERATKFAEAEAAFRTAYATMLSCDKAELLAAFEGSGEETIDAVEQLLSGVTGNLEQERWDQVNVTLSSGLVANEMPDIVIKAKEGKFEKIAPHYKSEITGYANHLLSLIPSRREEIAQGKASAAAEELRKQQDELEEKQKAESEAKALEQTSKAVADAVLTVQIQQADRQFSAPKAQAVESYSITITERAGWAEIFKFFLTHSDEQDLGKMKLDSMRLFAEKYAKANGVKIESEFIQYEAKYKAINKSRKAA